MTNADNDEHSILVLLDLTSSFDITETSFLTEHLNKCVGIVGAALNCLSSYLSNRKFQVVIDNFVSSAAPMLCGVLQGSICGPIVL